MSREISSISATDLAAVLARAERVFARTEIESAYEAMAATIRRELRGHDPLVLSVMIGGLVPTARLLARLDTATLQLDYVHATRYRLGTRGHELDWIAGPRHDVSGRELLVIDDVLDEGVTLMAIRDRLLQLGARRVCTAVLVDKAVHRDESVVADIVGLKAPDRYLFGCGMDYRGYFRNLDEIFAASPEDT